MNIDVAPVVTVGAFASKQSIPYQTPKTAPKGEDPKSAAFHKFLDLISTQPKELAAVGAPSSNQTTPSQMPKSAPDTHSTQRKDPAGAPASKIVSSQMSKSAPKESDPKPTTPSEVLDTLSTERKELTDFVLMGGKHHMPVASESPPVKASEPRDLSEVLTSIAALTLVQPELNQIETKLAGHAAGEAQCAALATRNESMKKYISLKKEELSLKRELQRLTKELNDQVDE